MITIRELVVITLYNVFNIAGTIAAAIAMYVWFPAWVASIFIVAYIYLFIECEFFIDPREEEDNFFDDDDDRPLWP